MFRILLLASSDTKPTWGHLSADGSFVETSSGPAARELKRRYDQHLGVGKDIRSPYAITAFVNQHGKPMYRVGSVLSFVLSNELNDDH